jgi:hypothetical protein
MAHRFFAFTSCQAQLLPYVFTSLERVFLTL